MEEQRYFAWHDVGTKKFYLEPCELDLEESKFLLYKVVEQTIQDYVLLPWSNISYKDLLWESARDFIFSEDYYIDWGDFVLNFEIVCQILDLEIDWVRRKTLDKYELEKQKRAQRQKCRTDA